MYKIGCLRYNGFCSHSHPTTLGPLGSFQRQQVEIQTLPMAHRISWRIEGTPRQCHARQASHRGTKESCLGHAQA
jgi:hypothetical protein